MQKHTTPNCSMPPSNIPTSPKLLLDYHEAGLVLHSLKKYAHALGCEVTSNTSNLIQKLNQYLLLNTK
jgi:hypothetical protein